MDFFKQNSYGENQINCHTEIHNFANLGSDKSFSDGN